MPAAPRPAFEAYFARDMHNESIDLPSTREDAMELFVFARFHARPGNEATIAEALGEVLAPTRREPGCLAANAFRALGGPQLFFIHSRWRDEAAFERHAGLPHTVRFLERVEPLIDHAHDIVRTAHIV